MPLFGKSQKSPQELVRSLKEALGAVVKGQAGEKKADKVRMQSEINYLLSELLIRNKFTKMILFMSLWLKCQNLLQIEHSNFIVYLIKMCETDLQ